MELYFLKMLRCNLHMLNAHMLRRIVVANWQYLWAMLQEIQECIHTVNWQYTLCLPTYFRYC